MIESLSLIISSLRLLADIYKVGRDKFKDKKTPERVEEIVIRAERETPRTVDAAEIERQITAALEPSDAAIVKADLELLSLLAFASPSLDAFDYWGQFTRLVGGLQAFAKANKLFELRGVNEPGFGQLLRLPRASIRILPDQDAAQLCAAYGMESVKGAVAQALLRKEGRGFPINVAVVGIFNEHSVTGRQAASIRATLGLRSHAWSAATLAEIPLRPGDSTGAVQTEP